MIAFLDADKMKKANSRSGGKFAPQFCCGMWGRVSNKENSRSSEDATVDVVLSCGILLSKVPVTSAEWVVPQSWDDSGRAVATGCRSLPPVGARVFVMMPSGGFSDAFVLCSGFPVASDDNLSPLFADGEEGRRKKSLMAGEAAWLFEYDETTGSAKAESPDGKISAQIDFGNDGKKKDEAEARAEISDGGDEKDLSAMWKQGGVASLSAFGGEFSAEHKKGEGIEVKAFDEVSATHKKGDSLEVSAFGITIKIDKDKKIEINAAGNVSLGCDSASVTVTGDATVDCDSATLTASGDATVSAKGSVSVSAKGDFSLSAASGKKMKIGSAGATLEAMGTVTPSAEGGPFNAIPVCPYTGAPHSGYQVTLAAPPEP